MVSKRERLEAAIAKGRADRPPVALWRHFPVDDQAPDALAQAHLAFQEEYDFDFLKVTPASSYCLKDWGVEDEWRGDTEGTRAYTRRVIQTAQDWLALPVLDPTQGALGEQLACLRILHEAADEAGPFVQTIFSPLAQAKNLAGSSTLMEHLHRHPVEVLAGLATIAQSTADFVQAAREHGISGIFYAIQHASYAFFDREAYSRFGEPFDRRILEAATGMWLNILHLHGEALMFELASDYPVQVVNWHDRQAGPSLEEGSASVAGAVCGGLHRSKTLVLSNPEQVRLEAQAALTLSGGAGVILGAGCVVPVTAPRANLKAARHAVDFA